MNLFQFDKQVWNWLCNTSIKTTTFNFAISAYDTCTWCWSSSILTFPQNIVLTEKYSAIWSWNKLNVIDQMWKFDSYYTIHYLVAYHNFHPVHWFQIYRIHPSRNHLIDHLQLYLDWLFYYPEWTLFNILVTLLHQLSSMLIFIFW